MVTSQLQPLTLVASVSVPHADPLESFVNMFSSWSTRSIGDDFLRRWAKWARSTASPNRIALGTLTITDNVSGFKTVCTGVSLQKAPDRTYDRTATNVTYTLLATTITEQ